MPAQPETYSGIEVVAILKRRMVYLFLSIQVETCCLQDLLKIEKKFVLKSTYTVFLQ